MNSSMIAIYFDYRIGETIFLLSDYHHWLTGDGRGLSFAPPKLKSYPSSFSGNLN